MYEKVSLGNRVHIGPYADFMGAVLVGHDVMFARDVHSMDGYHRWDLVGRSIRDSGAGEKVAVQVESDAWIGDSVLLMKAVTVGEGSVVGAKSLVLKDVPPYSVVVGAPARVVSVRFSDPELREHLELIGRSADDAERMIARRRSELAEAGYDGPGL